MFGVKNAWHCEQYAITCWLQVVRNHIGVTLCSKCFQETADLSKAGNWRPFSLFDIAYQVGFRPGVGVGLATIVLADVSGKRWNGTVNFG